MAIRILLVAALLASCGSTTAFAQADADRVEQAKRRLEEKQKAAKAAAATRPAVAPTSQPTSWVKASTRPATAPAAGKKSDKVVFVLDISASVGRENLGIMVEEVAKAIGSMRPDQSFGIIAANDQEFKQLAPALVPASPANSEKAYAFLKSLDTGYPDVIIKAMNAAAKFHPDVVWMLSDGDYPTSLPEAVMASATSGRFRVNTLQRFAQRTTAAEDFLLAVSAKTGGKCFDRDGKPIPIVDGKPVTVAPPIKPPPSGPSILSE